MYFSVLDLLVVVFAAAAALAAAGIGLMFLLKNKVAKKAAFYASVALGVLLSAAGIYVAAVSALPLYIGVAVAGALLAVGALVIERKGRDNAKSFVIARLSSVAALALGLYSLFLW